MNEITYISFTSPILKKRAQLIAGSLGLELIDSKELQENVVVVDHEYISLKIAGFKKEFYVDFLSGEIQHRVQHPTKESILSACGVKKGKTPSILDLTGGWGRDGYILANAGCKVLLLERDPIVHLLLEDGISRLKQQRSINIASMNIEAKDYLSRFMGDDAPDIIYYDPMRAQGKKAPKNKKEMEVLRSMVGVNNDLEQIVAMALKSAKERVVVKSANSKLDLSIKPELTLKGVNTKFDVFFTVNKN